MVKRQRRKGGMYDNMMNSFTIKKRHKMAQKGRRMDNEKYKGCDM